MFYFLKNKNYIFFLFFLAVFSGLFFANKASAAVLGETKSFSVDPAYDLKNRNQVSTQLILETSKIYFYIDYDLWQLYSLKEKSDAISNLSALSDEFSNNIYPTLTSNYGFEPNPGIDNDSKITILFHQLKRGSGGYFNSGNEYSKYEVPASNEREMVYLNSDYLASPLLKRLLAHEFTHLVTFNQKEKIRNIEEAVWLNEARAEYAITLCGYDVLYPGSNLQKRVVEFLKNPNDSLTDWQGISSDYGILNIFVQYLVDQYEVKILNDSLKSNYSGIESINYALFKYGYKEKFSDIFNNWSIAVFLNDCSYGIKYCYKNVNLKNLKVLPANDILPFGNDPMIYINYFSKSWAGYWDKITGGNGDLTFNFNGDKNGIFSVNYFLCDKSNKCEVASLKLDSVQNGKIFIDNFSNNYSSLIIISFAKNMDDRSLQFSLGAKTGSETSISSNENNRLLVQIEELKKQIAAIQEQLNNGNKDCGEFLSNLYFGLTGSADVSCLQKFLKNQGDDIYPEGLITGNFYIKTKNAVIRFQEKYASEILKSIGLSKGTGYVGLKTREKINSLLP